MARSPNLSSQKPQLLDKHHHPAQVQPAPQGPETFTASPPATSACCEPQSSPAPQAFVACAQAAETVLTVDAFKHWIRHSVRAVLPHGAMACGLGHLHAAGASMDYLIAVDLPLEHLAAITNPYGGIETPLMRRWLQTRRPVFFDANRPPVGIDPVWLHHFKRHQLLNAASDAVLDTQHCIGTYFSFHRLPRLDPAPQARLFAQLTPLLHETLCRVINHLQLRMNAEAQRLTGLTERELEIARWISQGKSNEVIAQLLGVSANTVKHHLHRAMEKCQCANRASLASLVAAAQHLNAAKTRLL